MSDLISRAELFDELNCRGVPYNAEVNMVINGMPSAQTEIIRCKDCMHNGSYDTDCPIDWNGKEYCSFAERREE